MSLEVPKETVTFILKRPNDAQRRKSWSILKVTRCPGRKAKYEKVVEAELTAINEIWVKKIQSFEKLEEQGMDLVHRLTRRERGKAECVVYHSDNLKILGDYEDPAEGTYWKEVYGKRTKVKDRRSAFAELRRAVEALGSISILVGSHEEIQKAVDDNKFKPRGQRRVCDRLMAIIRFLGREKEVHLEIDKLNRPRVKYLNETDFKKILPHIENEKIRILATMAFYSGMRFGELLITSEEYLRTKYVVVDWQLDPRMKVTEPKAGPYKAYLRPEGKEAFEAWFKFSPEVGIAMRKIKVAEYIKGACIKAFPNNPQKHIVFHDLRHCHAIHLLQEGVPLSFVAKSLGNSESVCERHYQGFVATDAIIDAMQFILSKKKSNESTPSK